MELLTSAEQEFEKTFAHVKDELASLRTGRANPMLVEGISVEAYDAKQPLKNVGTITTPDPRTIMIDVWDKALLAEVEKAVIQANIGLNPVNDGTVIRIPIPPLTEETRKDMVKNLKQRIEAGKIRLRKHRDDVRGKIAKQEKAGEITEDQKFHNQEKLDKAVKSWNEKLDEMAKQKEIEIMTV